VGVFERATQWSAPFVKTLALHRLDPLLIDQPALRLVLARICSVEQWVDDALLGFVMRVEPLRVAEVKFMADNLLSSEASKDIILVGYLRLLWSSGMTHEELKKEVRAWRQKNDPGRVGESSRG
jgi:hypothetical protein